MTRRRRRNFGGPQDNHQPPQDKSEPLGVMIDHSEDAEWVIDLTGWKQGDRRKFGIAAKMGEDDGDVGNLYRYMGRAIKAWPFDLDPQDIESYDKLEMEEFDEAMARLLAAFRDIRRRTG